MSPGKFVAFALRESVDRCVVKDIIVVGVLQFCLDYDIKTMQAVSASFENPVDVIHYALVQVRSSGWRMLKS